MVHDASVKSQQTGVFRTNCVDSLDRTNVVQSMLAARVLHQQFVVSLDVFCLLFPMSPPPLLQWTALYVNTAVFVWKLRACCV